MLFQPSNTQLPDRQLKGNDPLFLNDPDRIWQITSGTVALFIIYQGRRRYLFNLKPEEILFPITPDTTDCQLLAIALQDTRLACFTQAGFQIWMQQNKTTALATVENWILRLSGIVNHIPPHQLPTPIGELGILARGEIFQPTPGQTTWIRLNLGSATLLGQSELGLNPSHYWQPLTGCLWLQAQQLIELERHEQPEQIAPTIVFKSTLAMQTLLLKLLINRLQQEQREELQRLSRRTQLNQEAVSKTNAEFVEVFHRPQKQSEQSTQETAQDFEQALLIATGAVGRALGVPINPPHTSEDLRRLGNPLEAIALASRLRIRRISLRDRWWRKDCGPMIAYSADEGRPLALLPIVDGAYEIYDPLNQTRKKCNPTLAQQLAPNAYTFYRPFPDLVRPIDLLKFASHGHRNELVVIVMVGIVTTLLGMITPQATAILVDQAIPNGNRQMLGQMAFGLGVVAIGTMLFQITQSLAILRLETFADAATQSAIWDRLLKLKPTFFRDYLIGDLNSRVSAISQIRQRLGSTLFKSLFSGIFSFLNLGLLFYYSASLALIATLVAAINIAVTVTSGILMLKKTRPLIDRQGKLFGVVVQMINGVSKFRIAGAESRAFAYWGQQYRQQLQLMLATQGIEDNLAVINSLLAALTPAVLFAFATKLMADANAQFSLPMFLAFNAAFGIFISGSTSLSTIVLDVIEVLPIWQRAQPILQALPEVDQEKADPGRLTGRITIEHVRFRYRPDGIWNLDDVSIQAEPGEFIALVGASGSGKSTLLRLLLGFDTAESGMVCFDGQDLISLDVNAVRRQLGVVLQTNRLMSASILENIAGGKLISMDEAWAAAQMSGLTADIEAMPMGMHTVVSEGGTNLSGGQRQRLLIARALALRPRILIFDEATSALDNRTQQIVSDSLDQLQVTRIVVAHRLSTIRNADRIYVLDQGRVVQQGNFETLASAPGLFAQLIQRQQV